MLIGFFKNLCRYRVPVTLRELLDLFDALQAHVAFGSVEDFYLLSRAVMVKDEKFYDRFDQAFANYFEGLENLEPDWLNKVIPDEWLRKELEKNLSPEEFEKLKGLGSLEKIMDELRKRLEEQEKRHQGGNKWVGTGGTSPFGGYGANPEGVRMVGPSRNKRAVKVWEKREFRNLDDSVELGTRNIKLALRRLRKFARTGREEELDMANSRRALPPAAVSSASPKATCSPLCTCRASPPAAGYSITSPVTATTRAGIGFSLSQAIGTSRFWPGSTL